MNKSPIPVDLFKYVLSFLSIEEIRYIAHALKNLMLMNYVNFIQNNEIKYSSHHFAPYFNQYSEALFNGCTQRTLEYIYSYEQSFFIWKRATPMIFIALSLFKDDPKFILKVAYDCNQFARYSSVIALYENGYTPIEILWYLANCPFDENNYPDAIYKIKASCSCGLIQSINDCIIIAARAGRLCYLNRAWNTYRIRIEKMIREKKPIFTGTQDSSHAPRSSAILNFQFIFSSSLNTLLSTYQVDIIPALNEAIKYQNYDFIHEIADNCYISPKPDQKIHTKYNQLQDDSIIGILYRAKHIKPATICDILYSTGDKFTIHDFTSRKRTNCKKYIYNGCFCCGITLEIVYKRLVKNRHLYYLHPYQLEEILKNTPHPLTRENHTYLEHLKKGTIKTSE